MGPIDDKTLRELYLELLALRATVAQAEYRDAKRRMEREHWSGEGRAMNNSVKEHLFIFGTDERDAEHQRDLWLAENPSIKIVKVHGAQLEPQTPLTRMIGGKHFPRVSILVEYEPDLLAQQALRTILYLSCKGRVAGCRGKLKAMSFSRLGVAAGSAPSYTFEKLQ